MNNRFDDVLTQMAHDETSEFRIFIRLKMLYAWQVAMHSRLEACLIIFINKMLLYFFFCSHQRRARLLIQASSEFSCFAAIILT